MLRSLAIRPGPRAARDARATLVETSTTAARWLALLAIALIAAPAAAHAAPSTPCPGVRFLVTPALVPGSELTTDAVVLDADGTLTIASGCPGVVARVGRRGARSTVRARWTDCGGLRGARLRAKVDRMSCGLLTGTFTARGAKRRRFEAKPSTCGDGRLDTAAGEQCETSADCLAGQVCTTCICSSETSTTTDGRKKKTTTTATSSTTTSSTRVPTTTTSSSSSTSSTTTSATTSSTTSSSTTTSPSTTTSSTTTNPTTTSATTTSSTTTSSTTTTPSTTTPSTTTSSTTIPGGLFEAPNPWNTDVSTLPKSPASDGIIQALAAAGGWGFGSMRIDFSIEVLQADATTPFLTFTPTADFYTPDCDHVPFPVPPGGALEGETGYQCVSDGDCHLIVVHRPTKTLYEMWRANIVGSTFSGGCAAVWDLTRSYPATLRGDQCSSADAGGFPMAAMLFSADEVASGAINHAIRFILPNSRIRSGVFVRPATHAGGPTGGSSLPPYGVRFRLRADYPLASLPSEGARVIARAMQRYGMILSDGGNIALTAQSDRFTTHKWSEVGVDSHSLTAIQVSDMEVVGMGGTIPLTYDCVRTP